MQNRSLFYQKRTYYILLTIVLVVHLFALVLEMDSRDKVVDSAPLKVRILKELHKKQIVQSEDPEENKKPKDPAYLSDKDRSFDKQTLSKRIDTFQKNSKGNAPIEWRNSSKVSSQQKKDFKDLKLSDLGAAGGSQQPLREAAREYANLTKGTKTGESHTRSLSSTNDHVEDVPLGDLTQLNSVEYQYYGFYHRIRQKLEQFWGRSIQEKAELLMSDGRRLPASEELITALTIVMDRHGNIRKILIKGSSGIKELDDAAVESFEEAGPFPNPPKDLVVNGRVTLEWGFVVKS